MLKRTDLIIYLQTINKMLKYIQSNSVRIYSSFNESLKDKSIYKTNCNSSVNYSTLHVAASLCYAKVHLRLTISLVLLYWR